MRIFENTPTAARAAGGLVELTSERWTTKASATNQARKMVAKEGGEPCLITDTFKSSRSNRSVRRFIGGRIIDFPKPRTPELKQGNDK